MKRIEELNDGRLSYGKIEVQRDAETKKIKTKEFVQQGTLYYKEMLATEKDAIFNDFDLRVIEKKVKTYYAKDFVDTLKVIINDEVHDIIKCSKDKDKRYMYLYLKKVNANEER